MVASIGNNPPRGVLNLPIGQLDMDELWHAKYTHFCNFLCFDYSTLAITKMNPQGAIVRSNYCKCWDGPLFNNPNGVLANSFRGMLEHLDIHPDEAPPRQHMGPDRPNLAPLPDEDAAELQPGSVPPPGLSDRQEPELGDDMGPGMPLPPPHQQMELAGRIQKLVSGSSRGLCNYKAQIISADQVTDATLNRGCCCDQLTVTYSQPRLPKIKITDCCGYTKDAEEFHAQLAHELVPHPDEGRRS